jgi:hypothetical protein
LTCSLTCCSLGVDPIYLTVRGTYANPEYGMEQVAADVHPKRDIDHRRHNLRPRTRAPYVYLEGALGGASFFERVTVIVNGWSVEKEQMGHLHHMYQTFNRTMMTSERRKKKYNVDVPRVSTSFERKVNHPVAVVPSGGMLDQLLLSMEPVDWEDNNTTNTKVLRFGWDGESAAAAAVASAAVTSRPFLSQESGPSTTSPTPCGR